MIVAFNLLQIENGRFRSMVEETGVSNADMLNELAQGKNLG